MPEENTELKLTSFSKGSGCGCKIAPGVLKDILGETEPGKTTKKLLVGYESNDDAAVYDLGNGQTLISSVDFFTPLVDDPFDYGRIAAANSLSDIYAMGGEPALAIAVLGWPVEKLPASMASLVISGARSVCNNIGIPLAGGHSIESPEPFFGLSVNGFAAIKHLKKNNGAKAGDHIFLSKPIGNGILAAALKRNLLRAEDKIHLMESLTGLNSIGSRLGKLNAVTAMTDVTGFGLLGHLIEMAEGASLTADIQFGKVPCISCTSHYIGEGVMPDATFRNWNAYQQKIQMAEGLEMKNVFALLPDPQTNGGLLFTIAEDGHEALHTLLKDEDPAVSLKQIGMMRPYDGKSIRIGV